MSVQPDLPALLGFSGDPDLLEVRGALAQHLEKYLKSLQDSGPQNAADDPRKKAAVVHLLTLFFEYTQKWLSAKKKGATTKPNPESKTLKIQAFQYLKPTEQALLDYINCVIEINQNMSFIKQKIEDIPGLEEAKRMEWTSDAGRMLARHVSEAEELQQRQQVLQKGQPVADQIDGLFMAAETTLQGIWGQETARKSLTSLRSSLRSLNFEKARSIAEDLEKVKAVKPADKDKFQSCQKALLEIISLLESGAENLTSSEGKMFLSAKEVRLARDMVEKELEQKQKFILKYKKPYLESKIYALSRIRDKIHETLSLEMLLQIYSDLLHGQVDPLTEMKDLRSFETTLEKVKYYKEGPFEELKMREEEAVTIKSDIDTNLERFAAVLHLEEG